MTFQTSVFVNGQWKDVESQFVFENNEWHRVSDAYVFENGNWKQIHEQPYNWRIYGYNQNVNFLSKYQDGTLTWKNTDHYKFIPTDLASRVGTATPGSGVPASYNESFHGEVIWPLSKSVNGQGWIGSEFLPISDTIKITIACDNEFVAYLNQTEVLRGSYWPNFFTTTKTVIPGDPIHISINVIDRGGQWGACCRIEDAKTSFSTESVTNSFISLASINDYLSKYRNYQDVSAYNGWIVFDPPLDNYDSRNIPLMNKDVVVIRNGEYAVLSEDENDTKLIENGKTYNRGSLTYNDTVEIVWPDGSRTTNNIKAYDFTVTPTTGDQLLLTNTSWVSR